MCVLPLFLPLNLQSGEKEIEFVRSIFVTVLAKLQTRSDKGSAAKMAHCVLANIIGPKGILCDPSYFSRVWCVFLFPLPFESIS